MKRFDLSVKIDVPDDPFEAAEVIAKIKTPWYAMLQTLKNDGVKFEHQQAAVGKQGPASAPATKRQRKQRQASLPPQEQLPVAEDPPV